MPALSQSSSIKANVSSVIFPFKNMNTIPRKKLHRKRIIGSDSLLIKFPERGKPAL